MPSKQAPRLTLRELPPEAQSFIDCLAPMRGANTCRAYRQALRRFYQWLQLSSLQVDRVSRKDAMAWVRHLHEQGLAPATRSLAVNVVRIYLQYLESDGRLSVAAEKILSSRDAPKLPELLPRGLHADADRRLCKLLDESRNPLWIGLLLMRRTGIRVGELVALPYRCVREDSPQRRYLMVPVGKLNSERLVPIDGSTIALIERIQQVGKQDRTRLVAARGRKQATTKSMRRSLSDAVAQLKIRDAKPITTHRLRHTYATEMLNAGMALGALKEILGHLDVNMTLRYAKPTLDLLSTEYDAATKKAMQRYALPEPPNAACPAVSASELIETAVHIVTRNARERSSAVRSRAQNIIKRLERIGGSLAELGL